MLPKKRIPTHPGEVLSEEFLEPLGLTQVALAAHLGVPVQRINELVRGKRGVTPETAPLCISAGATALVAGSAVFRGGPDAYAANISALRGG